MTFVLPTFVLETFVFISISQLLLPWFEPNSKVPGTIFNSYQLSWWHFLRQHTSQEHLYITSICQLLLIQFGPNFKGSVHGAIFNRTKVFWTQKFLPKIFLWPKSVFRLKISLTKIFFATKIFFQPKSFDHFFTDLLHSLKSFQAEHYQIKSC